MGNNLPAKKRRKTKRKVSRKRAVKVTLVKSARAERKAKKKTVFVSRAKAKKQRNKSAAGKNKEHLSLRPTGNSIKKLRKKAGLSVSQFAERLGVSSATVYNWEKHRGKLNLQSRSLNALDQLTD